MMHAKKPLDTDRAAGVRFAASVGIGPNLQRLKGSGE
jgi:hypothetical protein